MSCQRHEQELWLYAIDALDEPGRRDAVETHLAGGCPACHGRLAEARETLAHLPLALDPQTPDAAARARVLARVRRGGSPLPRRWGLVALAAAITLAVVAWALDHHQQDRQRDEAVAAALDIFDADELSDALTDRMRSSARLMEALRSPEHMLISFRGVDDFEKARGHLIWNAQHEEAYLFLIDLDPPDESERSRLWLNTRDARHVPVQAFAIDEAGPTRMSLRWPVAVEDLAGASISYDADDEPDEPMRPVLVAQLDE
ncbi:MAG: hypothetical protein WD009_05345 [Phycisphaeraceae bacterium]